MTLELRDFCERGLIETVPHFNSLADYDKRGDLTPLLKLLVEESALPLRSLETSFVMESTGFVIGRQWVKCQAMVGVKTHIITTVEVTRGQGPRIFSEKTALSMIKTKFGDHIRSKTDIAQENEVLCKVLAHNLCCLVMSIHELGLEPHFWTQEPSLETRLSTVQEAYKNLHPEERRQILVEWVLDANIRVVGEQ